MSAIINPFTFCLKGRSISRDRLQDRISLTLEVYPTFSLGPTHRESEKCFLWISLAFQEQGLIPSRASQPPYTTTLPSNTREVAIDRTALGSNSFLDRKGLPIETELGYPISDCGTHRSTL
jgi:hypothetical protein